MVISLFKKFLNTKKKKKLIYDGEANKWRYVFHKEKKFYFKNTELGIFSLIKFFLNSKWKFFLPSKKRVLIYDKMASDYLTKFFQNKDYEILHTRFEQINIFVLLMSLFNFDGNRLSRKYIYKYIHCVKPELIITGIGNKSGYYKLKQKFKKTKIIAIQSAYHPDLVNFFENEEEKDKLSIDYLFVMSEVYKRYYSKLVKGNIIVSGSLKNNLIPIKKNEIGSKKLLFISQYRDHRTDKEKKLENSLKEKMEVWGANPAYKKYFLSEIKLLPMLAEYCNGNNIRLEICGSSKDHIREEIFYKSLVDSKIKNWKFNYKIDVETTYKMLDQTSAVVFISSTLGYEALARKKPTASFSIRGNDFEKNLFHNFAFPENLPDRGPFWTNYLNKTVLNEILDLVLNINKEEWEKMLEKYLKNIVAYDESNKKFKNIIKNLNIPLK